jgi:Tol biopolymer transport system component/DNA-binding winged helix-turn-helix (wHTH) protein
MGKQAQHFYEFGPFRIDTINRVLLRDGEIVPLKRKVFETLAILVEHNGEVLDKDELMNRLWPDSFVEESNLTQNVYLLRRALGEGPRDHHYIATIPGRGYRFSADIRELGGEGTEMVIETHTLSRVIFTEEGSNAQKIVPMAGESRTGAEQTRGTRTWPAIVAALERQKIAAAVALSVLILTIAISIFFKSNHKNTAHPSLLPPVVVPFTSYPGSESEPAFSPDGHQIAFVWDGDKEGNFDIYVKLLDVGKPLRLTTDPAMDHGPVWSPDGRYIAFLRRQTIGSETAILIPALGGQERKLGHVADGIDWSPDGQSLLISDKISPGEPESLYLLSLETGERRKLTSPPSGSFGDTHGVFSPDGKTIAFSRQISGGVEELYVAPLAGGETRQLTSDNRRIYSLHWARNGREIVFSSDRAGSFYLWSVSADGGAPERVGAVEGKAFDFAIAPQGSLLAYTQIYADANIWSVEATVPASTNKSAPTELISSSREEASPAFSPDGSRIAFASDRSGSQEVWICDSDGSNPLQLTSFGGPLTGSPHYSHDGKWIAFDSRPAGQADIFVIGAEGGKPRRLTTEDSTDVVPSWSRDDRWIYFSSNRSGNRQIWKIPFEGGPAVQVTKQGGFEAFESSDGKFLYYTKDRDIPGIWRMPVAGGEETLLPELLGVRTYRYWALADSGIYFVPETKKPRSPINFFSFATGTVAQVATIEKPLLYGPSGLGVSPDGRSILYTQVDRTASDVMLVKNFR